MRVVHFQQPPLPLIFFLCLLLFHAGFGSCSADQDHDKATTFEVVGSSECADCKQNNLETTQAFSGLHVTIDCKLKTGAMKRVGASSLDDQGKFKVSLPQDIVVGQKLKHECYAQLHNAGAMPCPAHNGLPKIAFVSQVDDKYTFSPSKPLEFSTALCTSKFLWPHYNYPPHPWKKNIPKIPYPSHPWKKNIPKIPYTPHPWKKNTHKIPFPPLYKHKPILMPHPPLYKKTFPPLMPHPPLYPPLYKKPFPPLMPHPPLYKKPFPPLMHKFPPLPKTHPKYFFKHPKYGFVPPKPQA